MKILKYVIFFLVCFNNALNPIQSWNQFPAQHLVTKHSPSLPEATEPSYKDADALDSYEDIVVFALKATIAAFHIDPKTFIEDRDQLNKYYERAALQQVEQLLLPGSGSGILDHCIVQQQTCDAITRAPVVIENETQHYLQVKLPMVLNTGDKLDVILSITKQAHLGARVTGFKIENNE